MLSNMHDCQPWLATSKLKGTINHFASPPLYLKRRRHGIIVYFFQCSGDSCLGVFLFWSTVGRLVLSCWNICWGVLIVGDSLPRWELCPVTQHVYVRYSLFGNLLCANSFIITLVKYGRGKMWRPLWTSCQRCSTV